jgi:hypothetical protein
MSTGERIVNANGVELCVESFGIPADPARPADPWSGLGMTAAHVVGMSQRAAVTQLPALDHADRTADIAVQLTNPYMIDAGGGASSAATSTAISMAPAGKR